MKLDNLENMDKLLDKNLLKPPQKTGSLNRPKKRDCVSIFKTSHKDALAGVVQWTECQPANKRVADLIPRLGHMPGLWARFPVGGA